MNTIVTSREDILHSSRELIRRQGWEAVNIRSVAAACGVSVGSIYNYFSSKAELVGATVESIWHEIFHFPQEPTAFADTLACVSWLYERMRYGSEKYPGFFTLHALSFGPEKADGKQRMYQTWDHVVRRCGPAVERRPAAGPPRPPGRFPGAFHGGPVCPGAVLAAVVRAAAAGLRPKRRAGDRSQDHLLKSPLRVGIFYPAK